MVGNNEYTNEDELERIMDVISKEAGLRTRDQSLFTNNGHKISNVPMI